MPTASSTINFDPTDPPRPLACSHCRWIYGVVMQHRTAGKRIPRLWVFVEAYDRVDSLPSKMVLQGGVRNLYRIHGLDQAQGIECSHCGCLNQWNRKLESYVRLMKIYGAAD